MNYSVLTSRKLISSISPLILSGLFTGCQSSTAPSNKTKPENNTALITSRKTVPLYPVDSSYLSYMPDTSIKFTDQKASRDYLLSLFGKFYSFQQVYPKAQIDTVYSIIKQRTAQIIFQERKEAIQFAMCLKSEKNTLNMVTLSDYSPFSRIVPLQERIRFYNTFPNEIKNSSTGKKTLSRLVSFQFTDNLQKNLSAFRSLPAQKSDDTTLPFADIITTDKPYLIMIFGASWCGPCIVEERILKYWSKDLDTSLFDIRLLSIDESEDKWKRYLAKEAFLWNTYRLSNSMKNSLIKALNFDGIPMNFLVDKQHRIIAQNTDIRKILLQIPGLNVSAETEIN